VKTSFPSNRDPYFVLDQRLNEHNVGHPLGCEMRVTVFAKRKRSRQQPDKRKDMTASMSAGCVERVIHPEPAFLEVGKER
jgi:hypothetical protein